MAIALNGMFWLAFAVGTALGVHPAYRDLGLLRWAMAALATTTAVILLLLARSLAKQGKLTYWMAMGFLAVIVVAALFDQLGLADLIFVIFTSIPIFLLLRSRTWYLQTHQHHQQGRAG
jgi:lysylphosphatidylglycerol synthetase-like protein (DUF2156 family)